jgi:hypothetical protein
MLLPHNNICQQVFVTLLFGTPNHLLGLMNMSLEINIYLFLIIDDIIKKSKAKTRARVAQ